jgi:hypothetical protein
MSMRATLYRPVPRLLPQRTPLVRLSALLLACTGVAGAQSRPATVL